MICKKTPVNETSCSKCLKQSENEIKELIRCCKGDVCPCCRAAPQRAGTTIGGDGVSPRRQLGGAATDDVDLTRPVERQVEARSADDVSGSVVRTLYFADTFLMNGLYLALSSGVLVCFGFLFRE